MNGVSPQSAMGMRETRTKSANSSAIGATEDAVWCRQCVLGADTPFFSSLPTRTTDGRGPRRATMCHARLLVSWNLRRGSHDTPVHSRAESTVLRPALFSVRPLAAAALLVAVIGGVVAGCSSGGADDSTSTTAATGGTVTTTATGGTATTERRGGTVTTAPSGAGGSSSRRPTPTASGASPTGRATGSSNLSGTSPTSFSDGIARVATGDAKSPTWGYIDTTGKAVTPVQYSDAGNFNEGLGARCAPSPTASGATSTPPASWSSPRSSRRPPPSSRAWPW